MHFAADGHVLLLHRLQQGGLSLRRRAIDLIGQNNMSENGTPLEFEDLSPRRIIGQDIGTRDIGRHEIRRKLYARETEAQDVAEAAHHKGFAQSGNSLQQAMTAANER